MLHKNATPSDGIHVVQSWEVADEATRLVMVPVAADVGKVCRQLDTGKFYILESDSPITWQELGGGSGTVESIIYRGYRTINQTGLTTNVVNLAKFDGKTIDTHNFFDNVTNFRFQPTDGIARYYKAAYSIYCVANPLSSCLGVIRKNGVDSAYGVQGAPTSNVFRSVGTDIIELNGSTDYLDFGLWAVGTTIRIDGNTIQQTTCSIHSIGRV
jgi:hypothetical protein